MVVICVVEHGSHRADGCLRGHQRGRRRRGRIDQHFGGGFNSTLSEDNPAPVASAQAVNP